MWDVFLMVMFLCMSVIASWIAVGMLLDPHRKKDFRYFKALCIVVIYTLMFMAMFILLFRNLFK